MTRSAPTTSAPARTAVPPSGTAYLLSLRPLPCTGAGPAATRPWLSVARVLAIACDRPGSTRKSSAYPAPRTCAGSYRPPHPRRRPAGRSCTTSPRPPASSAGPAGPRDHPAPHAAASSSRTPSRQPGRSVKGHGTTPTATPTSYANAYDPVGKVTDPDGQVLRRLVPGEEAAGDLCPFQRVTRSRAATRHMTLPTILLNRPCKAARWTILLGRCGVPATGCTRPASRERRCGRGQMNRLRGFISILFVSSQI